MRLRLIRLLSRVSVHEEYYLVFLSILIDRTLAGSRRSLHQDDCVVAGVVGETVSEPFAKQIDTLSVAVEYLIQSFKNH